MSGTAVVKDREFYLRRRAFGKESSRRFWMPKKDRKTSCSCKKRYNTYEGAAAMQAWVWKRYRDKVEVYQCCYCFNFHTGHRREGLEEKIEQRKKYLLCQLATLIAMRVRKLSEEKTDA